MGKQRQGEQALYLPSTSEGTSSVEGQLVTNYQLFGDLVAFAYYTAYKQLQLCLCRARVESHQHVSS